MGTVLIPEFLLLGQIAKRDEAACSLLQKDQAAKKKQPQRRSSFKSPLSPGHKPSLCSINEEAAVEPMDESTAPDEHDNDDEDAGKEGAEYSYCGLFGFLGPWLSLMCPSKYTHTPTGLPAGVDPRSSNSRGDNYHPEPSDNRRRHGRHKCPNLS